MGKAPNKCPMCGEVTKWIKVDTSKKGFSVGKAAVGGILLGPVGLVGGALGKKTEFAAAYGFLFPIVPQKCGKKEQEKRSGSTVI